MELFGGVRLDGCVLACERVLRGSILAPLTCAWLRGWSVLESLSFQMFSGSGRG